MLVRPKDHKCAIYHWSSSMHFKYRERIRLLFPYSVWNGDGQKNIYHYACKAKEWQSRYVQLIFIHAFRIRKNEMSPYSLWNGIGQKKHIPVYFYDQKTTNALYTIDLPPCISNTEKGNISVFLIRYETALDRKNIYLYACEANRLQIRYIPLI